MPSTEELLKQGYQDFQIVDDENHPRYFESTWPLNGRDIAAWGKRAKYSFPHVRPNSVVITPIGNMWVPHAWHRLQDMILHAERYSNLSIALMEIQDRCIIPGDAIFDMNQEAMHYALDSGAEWQFRIENDVLVEPDTLERLMEHDVSVCVPYTQDMERGRVLFQPELQRDTGLHIVRWAVTSIMLFDTKVFNATRLDLWQRWTELGVSQTLRHYGHRIYLDTSVAVGVARTPGFPQDLTWEEYWAKLENTWRYARLQDRDRKPPPDLEYDPVFSTGDNPITESGAYFPQGSPFRGKNGRNQRINIAG